MGKYRFMVQVEPRRVKVGDPISLRMVIQGDGPMELVQAPALASIDTMTRDFKVDDQALPGFVQDDAKLFTTSIRPLREDVSEVPSIPFSYFDPERNEFHTARSQPISITVAPNESLSLDAIVANRKPISGKGDSSGEDEPEQQDQSILNVDDMLQQYPDRPTATRITWAPLMIAPLGCLFGIVLFRRQWIVDAIRWKHDPLTVALRSVRQAGNASEIREALNHVCDEIPAVREIQRACDQATFSGTSEHRSLADLKHSALQALRRTAVAIALLGGWLSGDPLCASTVDVLDSPPLHLTTQQVRILLTEAHAAHREALEWKEADSVSSKAKLEKAIAKYELVLESGFRSPAVHRNLADALAEQGDFGRALATLEQARRWAGQDTSISTRIAELRGRIGHSDARREVNWWREVWAFLPATTYDVVTVIAWSLGCVLLSGMLLVPALRQRRFWGGLASVICCGWDRVFRSPSEPRHGGSDFPP